MGTFTCLTSREQKCGKTKFKAIDYCHNRACSTNLKIFTRCQFFNTSDNTDDKVIGISYVSQSLEVWIMGVHRGHGLHDPHVLSNRPFFGAYLFREGGIILNQINSLPEPIDLVNKPSIL